MSLSTKNNLCLSKNVITRSSSYTTSNFDFIFLAKERIFWSHPAESAVWLTYLNVLLIWGCVAFISALQFASFINHLSSPVFTTRHRLQDYSHTSTLLLKPHQKSLSSQHIHQNSNHPLLIPPTSNPPLSNPRTSHISAPYAPIPPPLHYIGYSPHSLSIYPVFYPAPRQNSSTLVATPSTPCPSCSSSTISTLPSSSSTAVN